MVEIVSILELCRHAKKIIRQVQKGKRLILTYRGQPVLRLEPIDQDQNLGADDPFYSLAKLAAP